MRVRSRRREGRAFGGTLRALANERNNKKVRKNYCSILFLPTNTSPLISFFPVQLLQKRMGRRRRREGRAFGGVPIAFANKGHDKKVRKNYCSILFLPTNASPLLSLSPVQHLQRRRKREGWAFGDAPM